MNRTQLQQIIKEEVESVLLEDDGAEDRFKFQWAYQFRRPQNKTTLDKMINDYDALVDYLHARTEPITNEEPRHLKESRRARMLSMLVWLSTESRQKKRDAQISTQSYPVNYHQKKRRKERLSLADEWLLVIMASWIKGALNVIL